MSAVASYTGPEQRAAGPRLRCLLSASLVMSDLTTMDCMVRNISASGARLDTSEAFRLPDVFDLRIPHHKAAHRARVIWRKGETAGVALADVGAEPETPGRGAAGRGTRTRRYPV